jgi:glycosyltransferase involved in cell wall biosynthesis
MQSLVVFSHLRWDSIVQRPQHLLSRLARRWRVVYVEEPIAQSEHNRLEILEPAPGVQVWRPHVTGEAAGFHDDHLPALKKLVSEAVRQRGIRDYWLWFYTPMALPLAADLRPRGIVYDCMDELSHFKGAPKQLVQRENGVFKVADLVFTAGPSLYNAKRSRHPDVHCFPSSVDAPHFQQATGEHPLHADIPRPRLGYCGVIDERINLDLLDAIAKARPEWNIVMVGPTVNIEPPQLPRRDNIHWLGQQDYDDLPRFIRGWDVGLLPFALNDATKFISPPQPLEYMACGRPSVSTSIRDVVEPYGNVVRVADTPEGFISDIEMIMERSPEEQDEHARELAAAVAATSWDRTAAAMAELIAQADELAGSNGVFVNAQPAVDEPVAAPLHLANAVEAVSVIGPADALRRAAAAGA